MNQFLRRLFVRFVMLKCITKCMYVVTYLFSVYTIQALRQFIVSVRSVSEIFTHVIMLTGKNQHFGSLTCLNFVLRLSQMSYLLDIYAALFLVLF